MTTETKRLIAAHKRDHSMPKIDEWIEAEAMMLVGAAAVFAEYRRWKELEAKIAAKLREAYELNR